MKQLSKKVITTISAIGLATSILVFAQSGTNGFIIACISKDAFGGFATLFSNSNNSTDKIPYLSLREQELHLIQQELFFQFINQRSQVISLNPTRHFKPTLEPFGWNEVPDDMALGGCRLSSLNKNLQKITHNHFFTIRKIIRSGYNEQFYLNVYQHTESKSNFTKISEIHNRPGKYIVGAAVLTCAQDLVRFFGTKNSDFTYARRRIAPHINIQSLEGYFDESHVKLMTYVTSTATKVTVETDSLLPVYIE